MLPMSTCAKRDKYTFILVKTNFDDDWGSFDTEQIVEIDIFYCSSTDSNTFIGRKRDNAIMEGGGGGVFFMNY